MKTFFLKAASVAGLFGLSTSAFAAACCVAGAACCAGVMPCCW